MSALSRIGLAFEGR